MQSYPISRPLALVAALVALQLTACSQPKPVAVVENEKESLLQFDNGKLIQFQEKANPNYRHIPCDLPAVETVVTNSTAFAALTQSGEVITWGDSFAGGDSREVTEQLKQVKQIVPVKDGFAALRQDGTVVYWGNAGKLSLDKALQARMTNITKLFANREALAALDANGKVHTWGYGPYGGNSLQVQNDLVDVVDIFAKGRSFIALKKDASAVVWGEVESSTNMKKLQSQLTDIKHIEYFQNTYAALKKDGSVVSWGWRSDAYPIRSALKDVASLTANSCAFAVLSPTGDAHFWGDGINCGVDWIKKTDITGVKEIISVGPGFLLLRDNATPQILADDTDYAYLFGFHHAQAILDKYWQQGSKITLGKSSFAFTRPDGKVVPVGYRADLKNVEQLIERIPRLTWLAPANDGFVGISEKGEWVSWSMNLGMFDKPSVQPADSLVVKPLEFTPAAQCETPEQRQAILSQARPQRKINWSFD